MFIRNALTGVLSAAWLFACTLLPSLSLPDISTVVPTRLGPEPATTTPDSNDSPGLLSTAPVLPPALPKETSRRSTLQPRPTVCSDSRGHIAVLSLESPTLHRSIPYSLYLPPCYITDPARLYPAIYLLHGASADHTQWPDLDIASNADKLIELPGTAPFFVVMPGGDYRLGEDYGAFVLLDLIPHIEQTQHISPDRNQRAIGGLSRGGAWALELGLTHPDRFSAVGGHSPVSDQSLKHFSAVSQSALRIYLDVGADDPLAAGVAAFAAELDVAGFKPTYHVYPGAHDRPYWRSHTAEYLAFYALGW